LGFSEGINLTENGKTFSKFVAVSNCLTARDYKGFAKLVERTGVIEIE